MYYADNHVHSTFSFDGKDTIEQLAARAKQIGLQRLCLTEHIEPHHPNPKCNRPPEYPLWFAQIERVRQQIPEVDLRAGLEIGDNAPYRQEIWETLDALPLDFRLLSLHLVDDVDPYEPVFFEGRDRCAAYRSYVEASLESVLHFGDFDALAHLGYCGKFAPFPPEQRPLRWHDAPDHLDMLLRSLAQQGKALEINTSGLRNSPSTIPGQDILRRFRELGGEFLTLGSDAHEAAFLTYRFEEAKALAVSAGFKWGATFLRREVEPYSLEA